MVNEFIAKKLGEVLAFSVVGQDTYDRGAEALSETLGEEKVVDIKGRMKNQEEAIRNLANELGVYEITHTKEEATGKKLREMRELYVGDQWHNPVELMEWSGFFEGAAVVHYALVTGAGEGISHDTLIQVAEEGMDLHQELLDQAHEELHSVGQERGQK
jgi:hypothetical protein